MRDCLSDDLWDTKQNAESFWQGVIHLYCRIKSVNALQFQD